MAASRDFLMTAYTRWITRDVNGSLVLVDVGLMQRIEVAELQPGKPRSFAWVVVQAR